MKETSQVLKKYKRFARYVGLVVQIFYIISAVGGALALLAACILLFLPASIFDVKLGSAPFTLSLDGFFAYELHIVQKDTINVKTLVDTGLFMTSMLLAGLSIFWRQIRLVLKSVQEDRPFAAENARRLTIVGILLLVGSVIVRLGLFVIAHLFVSTLGLTNASASFSVDATMFLGGFLILILAGVFHYGNILQQEYDATV